MGDSDGGRERFLIGLMTKALDGYEGSEVALPGLVAEVESVIEALFDVADEQWVERLRSAWSGLEIIHAVALDEDHPTLSDEEQLDVTAAIAELRSLVAVGNSA